ncbi:MAG: translation initiation factor IF-3, partial [[Eubacterium] sulci]|nr:translation initiation factor IF-3 [[Eubacterium] sulci]
REVMDKFAELCEDVAVVDKRPVMEGRSLVMFLAPKN